MPLYRLTSPGELVEARQRPRRGSHRRPDRDGAGDGRPRDVVVRRGPATVVVEVVEDLDAATQHEQHERHVQVARCLLRGHKWRKKHNDQ